MKKFYKRVSKEKFFYLLGEELYFSSVIIPCDLYLQEIRQFYGRIGKIGYAKLGQQQDKFYIWKQLL